MTRILKSLLVDFMEAFNFMVGVLLSIHGGILLGLSLVNGFELADEAMMLTSLSIGHLCLFISSQIHEPDEFDLDFYPIALFTWLLTVAIGIGIVITHV